MRTPPRVIAGYLRRNSLIIVVIGLLPLAALGRLNWLLPLLGAALAFAIRSLPHLIRLAPLLQRLWVQFRPRYATAGAAAGHCSTVEARFVRMQLDHSSGEIGGEVLEGAYAGKRLQELGQADLIHLYKECLAADQESATLVQAYLDRVYGEDWQNSAAGDNQTHGAADYSSLSREEAYQILGLEMAASREEIIAAHRRLMQKFHPDRGGSDYLAAKINQAKDLLLGE